jgi:hypothetical protein
MCNPRRHLAVEKSTDKKFSAFYFSKIGDSEHHLTAIKHDDEK